MESEKKVLLEKAFAKALVRANSVSYDEKLKYSILENAMLDYAKKHEVEFTKEEIKKTIEQGWEKIKKMTIDFNM